MKRGFRRAIFAVVYSFEDGNIQYLVLKRKMHWKGWEFPKGGIRLLETKRMAVKREVREETNLKPISIKKFPVKGQYEYLKTFPDRRGFIGQTYHLYAVEVKKDKIKWGHEHSGYKWLDLRDAVKRVTHSNQKECLKIVHEWILRNRKI
jgi:8-oxo-dGTP pyrophosphatase MutT (NUDIX family)